MSAAEKKKPEVPVESVVYGEVIYWLTILAAILCMVGPVIALASPGNNCLNPTLVFENIFAEEEPGGVWALSAAVEPELPVRVANAPEAGEYEAMGVRKAIGILADFEAPAMDDPAPEMTVGGELRLIRSDAGKPKGCEFRLHRIHDGHEDSGTLVSTWKARTEVLDEYKDVVVTDGHFWMENMTSGCSLTQFGLALGCSVALWGLLLAAGIYLGKRNVRFAVLALWVAVLVFVSAAGFVNLH
ncbi:MAG: hypothetical protein ABFS86_00130 [Planctomycetota bacterium]